MHQYYLAKSKSKTVSDMYTVQAGSWITTKWFERERHIPKLSTIGSSHHHYHQSHSNHDTGSVLLYHALFPNQQLLKTAKNNGSATLLVLMAVAMKITVFWDVTPSNLVHRYIYQRFGRSCYLHKPCGKIRSETKGRSRLQRKVNKWERCNMKGMLWP